MTDFRQLLAAIWAGHKFPVLIAPASLLGTPVIIADTRLFGAGAFHFGSLVSLAALAWLLIVVTNWLLFRHLITISGRRDSQVEIPAAIVRSALLLFGLINLYAAIYSVELGAVSGPSGVVVSAAVEAVRWFYFSTVTFSTLGYGDITPNGNLAAEMTTSIEALNGLIAFGVFTGALTTYLSKSEA